MEETPKRLTPPKQSKKSGIVKIDKEVTSIEINLDHPTAYKVVGNGTGKKKGKWILKVTAKGKVILV